MKIKECKHWERAIPDMSGQAAIKAAFCKLSLDLRHLRELLRENDGDGA